MIGVLGDDSAFVRLSWANEMNFVMNHAPDTESIARPVEQQSARYHCTTDAPT